MSDSIKAIFLNEYGDYECTRTLSAATPQYFTSESLKILPSSSGMTNDPTTWDIPRVIATKVIRYSIQGRIYSSHSSAPLSHIYVKEREK